MNLVLSIYKNTLSFAIKLIFFDGCRYQPTCSEYCLDAVSKYGPLKGTVLTLKRLSRCHPFGGSGYDPVK